MTDKLNDQDYSLYLLGYAQGAFEQLNAMAELEILQLDYLPVAMSLECGYEAAISHLANDITPGQFARLGIKRLELIDEIRRLAELCLEQADEDDNEAHPLFA